MRKKKENDEGVPFYLLLESEMHYGDRNLTGDKALVVSMSGGQKITVSQIADDLGYERT